MRGIGFGFGKRSDFTHVPHLEESPGPAHYEAPPLLTRLESSSQLPGVSMPRGARDIDHLSKVQLTKNLEHRLRGQEGPGPGFYQQRLLRRRSMVTIPKGKRQLSEVSQEPCPGPGSYYTKLDLVHQTT